MISKQSGGRPVRRFCGWDPTASPLLPHPSSLTCLLRLSARRDAGFAADAGREQHLIGFFELPRSRDRVVYAKLALRKLFLLEQSDQDYTSTSAAVRPLTAEVKADRSLEP